MRQRLCDTELSFDQPASHIVITQDHGKGGAFMTVLAVLAVLTVLAVLQSTLPSLRFSYKIQYQEAAVTVLTVLAVSAVVAVSVVTATPLKLNPPFP